MKVRDAFTYVHVIGNARLLSHCSPKKSLISVSATGSGKTITFWLPMMREEGLTIIIMPLKSLGMQLAEELEWHGWRAVSVMAEVLGESPDLIKASYLPIILGWAILSRLHRRFMHQSFVLWFFPPSLQLILDSWVCGWINTFWRRLIRSALMKHIVLVNGVKTFVPHTFAWDISMQFLAQVFHSSSLQLHFVRRYLRTSSSLLDYLQTLKSAKGQIIDQTFTFVSTKWSTQ